MCYEKVHRWNQVKKTTLTFSIIHFERNHFRRFKIPGGFRIDWNRQSNRKRNETYIDNKRGKKKHTHLIIIWCKTIAWNLKLLGFSINSNKENLKTCDLGFQITRRVVNFTLISPKLQQNWFTPLSVRRREYWRVRRG